MDPETNSSKLPSDALGPCFRFNHIRLKRSIVPAVEDDVCDEGYRGFRYPNYNTMFCTGGDGKDSCNGDSGGLSLASFLGATDVLNQKFPGVNARTVYPRPQTLFTREFFELSEDPGELD